MDSSALDVAVNKLRLAQEHMVLLGRKTTIERGASFLLFQAKRPQPRGVAPPRIHLPMPRLDIADSLGVTVETVCRSLTKLAKSGVIAIPNIHEVVIVDRPRLESLAHGISPGCISHPAERARDPFGSILDRRLAAPLADPPAIQQSRG